MSKPVLVNRGEIETRRQLAEVAETWGATVLSKVRLSDVLSMPYLPSRTDWNYASRAHLDFLITEGPKQVPCFGVEFDGPSHHLDSRVQRRDAVQERLCAQADLPLLRIDALFLRDVGQFTLLGMLVELWFLRREFEKAQSEGRMPWDESFSYLGFVDRNGEGFFGRPIFMISWSTKKLIVEAYRAGLTEERFSAENVFEWPSPNLYCHAFSLLPVVGGVLVESVSVRNFSFPAMQPWQLAVDLAEYGLGKNLQRYIDGLEQPKSELWLKDFRRHTEGWMREGQLMDDAPPG